MSFAARVRSEPGWQAAFVKSDGSIAFVDILEWGLMYFGGATMLVPLDPISGDDIRKKPLFIAVIDRGDPTTYDKGMLAERAETKLKTLKISDG